MRPPDNHEPFTKEVWEWLYEWCPDDNQFPEVSLLIGVNAHDDFVAVGIEDGTNLVCLVQSPGEEIKRIRVPLPARMARSLGQLLLERKEHESE